MASDPISSSVCARTPSSLDGIVVAVPVLACVAVGARLSSSSANARACAHTPQMHAINVASLASEGRGFAGTQYASVLWVFMFFFLCVFVLASQISCRCICGECLHVCVCSLLNAIS